MAITFFATAASTTSRAAGEVSAPQNACSVATSRTVDDATIAAYEAGAAKYAQTRPLAATSVKRAAAFVAAATAVGPVVDLGCGPGDYLALLDAAPRGAIGLDATQAMLDHAGRNAPAVPVCRGDLEYPPFPRRSLGGIWARYSLVHLAATAMSGALPRLREAMSDRAPLAMSMFSTDQAAPVEGPLPDDDLAGRFFTLWPPPKLCELVAVSFTDVRLQQHESQFWIFATA